ncbi:MAG: hypothetical protein EOM37_10385 [Proteobacteria bacterium]|nr:hypothetical protein [Pseudomonadota bacterium]
MIISNKKIFLTLLSVYFLSGCVANSKQKISYEKYLNSGAYVQAAEILERDANSADILTNLNYGYVLRCNKDYKKSIETFDKAENIFKATEEDWLLHDSGKAISAALVNEGITPYTGKIYELSLANIYKSKSFISLGNFDLARVEINRALDRQRRAKEFFSSELDAEKKKAAVQSKNNSGEHISLSDADKSSEISKVLSEHYSNMNNFELFANYTNPYITYFSGVYFLLSGDILKSVDLLKEASAMSPENRYIKDDLLMAIKASTSINGRESVSNTASGTLHSQTITDEKTPRFAWILFENGSGPELESLTIPIPLIVVTSKVPYTEVALPRHKDGPCALNSLSVSNSRESLESEIVADMNAVALTEFKSRFPAVLIRSIVSASVKSGMQVVAHKLTGDIGALALGIYTAVATEADTRNWSSLPSRYELAKIRIDGTNGELKIGPPQDEQTLSLNPTSNHLVFVNKRTNTSPFFIDSVAF